MRKKLLQLLTLVSFVCYYVDTNAKSSSKKEGVVMDDQHHEKYEESTIQELCEAMLLLKDVDEMYRFLKDLCTPQEINILAERWRVCRILNQKEFSYREISSKIGANLGTIGRVARFLNIESYGGYRLVLERMKQQKQEKLEKNEK